MHRLDKPKAWTQIRNALWSSLVTRRKSIQESMLYSDSLKQRLHALVAELEPDLVIYDTLRIGQFFETEERVGGRHILYMDDLFSVRYARMLEVLDRFSDADLNPLGNFARMIPAFLRPFVQLGWLKRALLRLERSLIERREIACVRWFDRNLLISAEEVARLKGMIPSATRPIEEIKPLMKEQQAANRAFKGEPTFVFLGALNIPHNEYSLIHF